MQRITSKIFIIPFITVMLFWTFFMVLLVGAGILASSFPGQYSRLANGLGGSVAALVAVYVFLRLQQKSLASIGLTWEYGSMGRFILGFIIGSIALALMIAALYVFANVEWKRNDILFSKETIVGYVAVLPLAYMEEVAFRSYPFITLQRRYGLWVAQIVVAVAFALYHLPGGNSLLGVLLGPGIWGLIFGIAAAWSRGISVPLGIHAALNAGQMVMGLKGTDDAIWKISDSGKLTSAAKFDVNQVGMAMQLAVLFIAICLTFLYTKTEAGFRKPIRF